MTKVTRSIYIYYISGTGNARAASYWIADQAVQKGIEAKVQQIDRLENIEMPEKGSGNLIGFSYPTHGFNAAPLMLRFIAGFPRGLGKEVFLLNTRGGLKLSRLFIPGLSGVALILPAFILFLKGYRCVGFRQLDMPSNWISLHPGLRTAVIESIYTRCERIVRSFTDKLLSGRNVYRGLFSLPVDLAISPVALGYYIGGRFFLAKTFIANNKCNNCGICIKECPTASIIEVSGRPYWKLTCESCMRCMNRCPQRAVESAHGMALIFWLAFSAINAQLMISIINHFTVITDTAWWWIASEILGIAVMIAVTAALYRLIHYAMAFKPVSYLVRFTSLTTLPFWRRYNRRKNNKLST
jgi:Pyruvate/2-oxoacid:ferredoxin oxidoreductase delta subunit